MLIISVLLNRSTWLRDGQVYSINVCTIKIPCSLTCRCINEHKLIALTFDLAVEQGTQRESKASARFEDTAPAMLTTSPMCILAAIAKAILMLIFMYRLARGRHLDLNEQITCHYTVFIYFYVLMNHLLLLKRKCIIHTWHQPGSGSRCSAALANISRFWEGDTDRSAETEEKSG